MEKAFYAIDFSLEQILREMDQIEPGILVYMTTAQLRTNLESYSKQPDAQTELKKQEIQFEGQQ